MLYSLYSSRRALTAQSLVLSVLALLALSHAAVLNQTLAQNGDGPFKYYRITSLASLGNGIVLASFDGRPDGADAPSPNSILQRRSTDNGESWGSLTYIAQGRPGSEGVQKYGFSDPSYVIDSGRETVFNLHVFSKDQGFSGSVLGNNDTDVDVLSAEVSVSTDAGLSWTTDPDNQPDLPPVASGKEGAPPLITTAIKPVGATVDGVDNVGGVLGAFATSGQGIQLKYGKYAGRLVQPFVGSVVQRDGSTASQAYSVYSDDSGSTWQMGTPVGTGMDENKVVELSNGTLMLNSRSSDGSGYRKVALSNDGGETYSTPRVETQLPDPGCNGAITQMYPDAEEGSDLARILLFTNANSQESRVNGTVRYSCDDGNTWSAGKVFSPGATSYSTVTALDNDMFGIFYEALDNELVLLRVDANWLGVSC
ncbi:sialidase family protein [Aspergillus puulaauensis]|uniref:Sialidase domain-containing protein n=1 Tax=Aspergillus puulaauensis TaxID=1220207 RepID=A0A7R8ANE2_9EURO|nr:uncharacterized protein APUU_31740S [Aspergillus puulaauensis]BCS23515.1 hypothetical protein APUU_31740S [Aspergillus puulaauensis]